MLKHMQLTSGNSLFSLNMLTEAEIMMIAPEMCRLCFQMRVRFLKNMLNFLCVQFSLGCTNS